MKEIDSGIHPSIMQPCLNQTRAIDNTWGAIEGEYTLLFHLSPLAIWVHLSGLLCQAQQREKTGEKGAVPHKHTGVNTEPDMHTQHTRSDCLSKERRKRKPAGAIHHGCVWEINTCSGLRYWHAAVKALPRHLYEGPENTFVTVGTTTNTQLVWTPAQKLQHSTAAAWKRYKSSTQFSCICHRGWGWGGGN